MYRYTSITLLALALPTLASAACIDFPRTLQYKDSGNDVLMMQKVLNSNSKTQLTGTGSGSPGMEIDFFGPATYRAVKKFQTLYRDDVLAPANLTQPTGIAGELTRKKLAELSCSADTSITTRVDNASTTPFASLTPHESIFASSPYRTKVNFHNAPTLVSTSTLENTDPNLKRPAFSVSNSAVADPGQSITLDGHNFQTNNSINVCGTISDITSNGNTISITIPQSTPPGICNVVIRNSSGKSDPFTLVIRPPSMHAPGDSSGTGIPSAGVGTSTTNTDPKYFCENLERTLSDVGSISAGGDVSISNTSPWNIKDGMTVSVSGKSLNTGDDNIEVSAGYGDFTFPGVRRSYPYNSPSPDQLFFTLAPGSFSDNGTGSVYRDILKSMTKYDEALIFHVKNAKSTSNESGLCRINPDRPGAGEAPAGPFASPGVENITVTGSVVENGDRTGILYLEDGRTIPLNIPISMNTYSGMENIVEVSGNINKVTAQEAHPGLGGTRTSSSLSVARSIYGYVTANKDGILDIVEQGSGYGYKVLGQPSANPGTFWTFNAAISPLDVTSIKFIGPRLDLSSSH